MADTKVQRKVRNKDADNLRSRGSPQAVPDPQLNGTMEFPRALDRSRPAPCEGGDQVINALGLEGASQDPTPGVVAKGETRVEDNDGSIDPELEQEETTIVPCGRGEAELFVPRLARHYVCHYEAVLKDVSAGRTRPEEQEESGSVPRWKATNWGVCLNGRLIQVHCTPFLKRVVQETRQSRKSASVVA